MSLDIVDKIVKEVTVLKANGGVALFRDSVGFYGVGEPLLHPEFKTIASMCRPVGWGMGTNCDVLGEHIDEIIDNQFTEILLDLDAATPETFDKIRPSLSGHFDKAVRNIELFLEALKGKTPWWKGIYICFIVNILNYSEIDKYLEHWLPRIQDIPNCQVHLRPMVPMPESRANALWGYTLPQLNYIASDKLSIVGDLNAVMRVRDGCCLMDYFFIVFSDGNASICCRHSGEDFIIGNIKDNTIIELFNNPVAENLRYRFKARQFDTLLCKYCP
jgi:MoaA/NifB/PqqE/SkfB family radical SAM enzyme